MSERLRRSDTLLLYTSIFFLKGNVTVHVKKKKKIIEFYIFLDQEISLAGIYPKSSWMNTNIFLYKSLFQYDL